MTGQPLELTLELEPAARFDLIDVRSQVVDRLGEHLRRFRRTAYCSYHTTAGFLEESLAARLRHRRQEVDRFIEIFRRIFPEGAGYSHDQMERRTELTLAERRIEPRNADSHLAYIGSGLRNCVTYANLDSPVFLVELDGLCEHSRRRRRATVLAYDRERRVHRELFHVPVSRHPVDSVNLSNGDSGLSERLAELLARHGIEYGRVDLTLAGDEQHAGLTVNEYETLLMKHDLAEVLRNPFHFAAEKGRHILADPAAVPAKAWNYAKYDFVHLVNEALDVLGLSESIVERWVARAAAIPASRMLRMKRSVSLLVARDEDANGGRVIQGRYQSPILFQWQGPAGRSRRLEITLTRFD